MKRIFPIINAVIAITFGVIVLLGYFVDGMALYRIIILQVAVLLAGVAVLIGVGNLMSVHLQKIRQQKPGAIYSLVLLVFFLMAFVVTLAGYLSSSIKPLEDLFLNGIMVPAKISLTAVLSATLLYSSARMLRWRLDFKTILFLLTAVLLLLVGILQIPGLGSSIEVFAGGGARGILIGLALGTLTTGLRILFGADRPYGGK